MGALIQTADVAGRRAVDDVADVVIVGSGAAGATAARVLAEAGVSVIVIEEGAPALSEALRRDVWSGLRARWRDAGAQAARGRAFIPILQGVCVGGSTAINGAIIRRMPEAIHALWQTEHGLGEALRYADLTRVWDVMDSELRVGEAPEDVLGQNNLLMRDGARALGIASSAIRRNVDGCRGSARCLQGCPTSQRQSMDVTYVPRAMAAGARVYATCKAERVFAEGGRAAGVRARFVDRASGRRGPILTARARRAVIVAASAVQTPLLLLASGLGRRSGLVGRRFQAHPGTSVVGVFHGKVEMSFGATQGWESTHFWNDRMKFETVALPPELAAVRLPGFGAELVGALAGYDHLACWGVQLRARAHGRVRPALGGGAAVAYDLTDEDARTLKRGVTILAEMLFAAGAREVLPGVFGLPERVRSMDGVRRIDALPDDPRLFHCIATHLFGTAVMGPDPATSVVATDGQSHELPGLYVADSSIFPTNLGVNPQHTIAAVAWLIAERIAQSA